MNASEVETTPESSCTRASCAFNESERGRDPLHLFVCHLAWRYDRNVRAYQEVLAALDDCDPSIRALAESLLRRHSPRPESKTKTD